MKERLLAAATAIALKEVLRLAIGIAKRLLRRLEAEDEPTDEEAPAPDSRAYRSLTGDKTDTRLDRPGRR